MYNSVDFNKSILSRIHHYSVIQNNSTTLKNPLCITCSSSHPQPLAIPNLFIALHSFAFYRMSHSWNHKIYSLFRFAYSTYQYEFKIPPCHFMAWQSISFICLIILHCLNVPLFIHSPIKGNLGWLQFLAVLNKAIINTCVCRQSLQLNWVNT